jgi:hypothetical protein
MKLNKCGGEPETARSLDLNVAPIRLVQQAQRKDKLIVSGLLFFGSFLLEGQKK